jgi:hypothetical protein
MSQLPRVFRWCLAGALALVLCGIAGVKAAIEAEEASSRKLYDQIQVGMSKQELRDLLGWPSTYVIGLAPDGCHGELWFERSRARIIVGEDDKHEHVRYKRYLPAYIGLFRRNPEYVNAR